MPRINHQTGGFLYSGSPGFIPFSFPTYRTSKKSGIHQLGKSRDIPRESLGKNCAAQLDSDLKRLGCLVFPDPRGK